MRIKQRVSVVNDDLVFALLDQRDGFLANMTWAGATKHMMGMMYGCYVLGVPGIVPRDWRGADKYTAGVRADGTSVIIVPRLKGIRLPGKVPTK